MMTHISWLYVFHKDPIMTEGATVMISFVLFLIFCQESYQEQMSPKT